MNMNLISIGNKISLHKINITNPNEEVRQLISQVLDIEDENTVKIMMPFDLGKTVPLEVNDQYWLCFYTYRGLFQCRGQIVDRYMEEKIPMIVVQIISDLEKYQRRQYYRLDIILDVEYLKNYDEEDKEVITEGIITDISGGGARLTSVEQLRKEEVIVLKLCLPASSGRLELHVQSRVIESIALINKPGLFEHRVEFINIEVKDRESIIKYIFEEERRQRQREKGID